MLHMQEISKSESASLFRQLACI